MLRIFTLSFCIFAFSLPLSAQAPIGGRTIFPVLDMSPSARVTALGGSLIAVSDGDASLAFLNPALLSEDMHSYIGFHHSFYLADIQHGFASYAHHLEKADISLHGGFQYLGFGDFEGFDEFQVSSGSFKASEMVATIGASKPLYDRLTVGANIKFTNSALAEFESTGISADLGAYYHLDDSNLSFAFVIRNIGSQLSKYTPGASEDLPLDIQFGLSKKLKYLPFRLSVTAHSLQRWNLLYDDPNAEEDGFLFVNQEQSDERSKFGAGVENFFRHMIFSGEFLFGQTENVRLRLAYNHLRRQELNVENLRSLAGFSFGLGVKVSKFRVGFGHAIYHQAGGSTHFTFSTRLSEFAKAK